MYDMLAKPIRPKSKPRLPSESTNIIIQGYFRGCGSLHSPNLIGQHPEESIAQCFAVAVEKKASDWAVFLPDSLKRLSVKHKDQELTAVKCRCSEAVVLMAVSIIISISK